MKVCIITSVKFPPEEGIGNYIHNLSKELMKNGHSVTIITRGGPYRTKRSLFDGIELYRVTFLPLYPFHVQFHGIFVKRLLNSIGKNFDLVHYHTPLPPAIKVEVPVITTVHTPMKADTGKVELVNPFSVAVKLQGKISYLIEKDLFRKSDKITAVARSVAHELAEYGLNPEDIAIIGNGVDETLFRPSKNRPEEKYILYTGRLSYRKGLFDFIESCKIVCSKYPDVKVKIVGNGQLFKEAEKRISATGHANRFELLGFIGKSELVKVYQGATVFVMPSHYEGLPTTLLEAMACGIPVVATAVSGNLDVIEDGKNGFLVPIRSPDKMAAAISGLLENERMRANMGLAARKTIEEKFSWDKIYSRIIYCYKMVV